MSHKAKVRNTSRSVAQKKTTLAVQILRELYRNTNGKEISLQHRKETDGIGDLSLTYGEIVTQSFMQILALTQSSSDKIEGEPHVFVDLGCGTGKPVLCAALSPFQFTKVWGIEIIPALTEQAVMISDQLQAAINEGKNIFNNNHSLFQGHTISSGDTSTTHPSKQSKRNKFISFEDQILSILSDHTSQTNENIMTVESLANQLCVLMGHKKYKEATKQHKTFLRYLKTRDTRYVLSDEDKVVSLL